MSIKRGRDFNTYFDRYNKRTRFAFTPSAATVGVMGLRGRPTNRYRSRYSNYSRRRGPYTVLTQSGRHSNPVYPKPELKIYDADVNAASPPTATQFNITNTGTVACVNAMVTGTGVQNFIGNQISVKSAAYRFELDLGTTPVATSGRVLLIWDKQPNGSLATWADIFAFSTYLSFSNVNTRDRFVILRNDQFSLSPQGDQTLFFERFVNINMTTTFVNGQATTAVPQTGALLIAYIADQGTAANQPRISGNIRVRYYDN